MQVNKNPDYIPQIFSIHQGQNSRDFWLLNNLKELVFLDLFENQKKELFKIRNPQVRLNQAQLDALYESWAAAHDLELQGTWVYYPWANRMIRILNEDEFVELRTSRNQHKITAAEQLKLQGMTIGIIGLSVGNAVAATLAIERIGGHLKLADFDELELSNLNRIRAGLHQLGLNKAIVTAREIAEIDPYLKITCYTEGIHAENIDHFIHGDSPLDLLIDECDDLQVKILARLKAKEYGLPLVMETSDRGMLDIERYDLNPDLPIFHGMLADLPTEMLNQIPAEHKMGLVMRIIEAHKTSARGRASLLELGQTIGTWPQLASAVAMGGGVVGDISRKILLSQHRASGRFYVDLEDILSDVNQKEKVSDSLTTNTVYEAIQHFELEELPSSNGIELDGGTLADLTRGLIGLPEQVTGLHYNWYWSENSLHLIIDPGNYNSFAHYHNLPSKILLGLTLASLKYKAAEKGLSLHCVFNKENQQGLIHHAIAFTRTSGPEVHSIADATNLSYYRTQLTMIVQSPELDIPTGKLVLPDGATVNISWITDKVAMAAMDSALGKMRTLMLLNELGHSDFYARAIITQESGLPKFPGFDFDQSALTAFSMLADYRSAAVLKSIDGGALFKQIFTKAYQCKLGYLRVDLPKDPMQLGALLTVLYLAASELKLTVEPLFFPTTLSSRSGTLPEDLDQQEHQLLQRIQQDFCQESTLSLSFDQSFLIRISSAEDQSNTQRQLQMLNFVIDTTNPTHE